MASSGGTLVFFALAMIYAVLIVFALIRIRKIHNFSQEWRHSKIFYFLIVLQAALRTVLFLILCFSSDDTHGSSLFCLISVPDSLFIVTYFMMFWQLLSVFYYAHFDSQHRNSFLAAISMRPNESCLSLSFLMVMLGWLLVQGGLYLALLISNGAIIGESSIWTEVGTTNLVLPTIVLASMIALQVIYSGRPLRSSAWKRKLWKMIVCTVIWSLGRYFDGVLSLSDSQITEDIGDMISGSNKDVLSAGLLIAYLIVSEGICMFLVLDYSFMAIFVLSEEEHLEASGFIPEKEPLRELSTVEEFKNSLDGSIRKFTVLTTTSGIEGSELTEDEPVPHRKNGLGILYRAKFKGHSVLCRKIAFPRISNYVVEEFTEEIESLKQLDVPFLVPYHGAVLALPVITIVTPWFPGGSLYSVLHNGKPGLFSIREKLVLASRVARCLDTLHSLGRNHGHLNSHNILLEEGNVPYVADLGLGKIKKYAGLVIGYSCKTAWTSPELLSEKCSTPVKVQNSDDVYSFGVVLWELITEREPFPGQTRSQLLSQVVAENLRPEIPHDLPNGLSQLIKSCWNTDPAKRPDFPIILQTLERAIDNPAM